MLRISIPRHWQPGGARDGVGEAARERLGLKSAKEAWARALLGEEAHRKRVPPRRARPLHDGEAGARRKRAWAARIDRGGFSDQGDFASPLVDDEALLHAGHGGERRDGGEGNGRERQSAPGGAG